MTDALSTERLSLIATGDDWPDSAETRFMAHELAETRARIDAVRALHPKHFNIAWQRDECEACIEEVDERYGEVFENYFEWPCPTVRALESL